MAQNLTALVSDNGNCSDATAPTSVVNFKPKDTNGWKDYKKLKTYLILKEQQNEKVTTRVGKKGIGASVLRPLYKIYYTPVELSIYVYTF